jgi:hypothetical protein
MKSSNSEFKKESDHLIITRESCSISTWWLFLWIKGFCNKISPNVSAILTLCWIFKRWMQSPSTELDHCSYNQGDLQYHCCKHYSLANSPLNLNMVDAKFQFRIKESVRPFDNNSSKILVLHPTYVLMNQGDLQY